MLSSVNNGYFHVRGGGIIRGTKISLESRSTSLDTEQSSKIIYCTVSKKKGARVVLLLCPRVLRQHVSPWANGLSTYELNSISHSQRWGGGVENFPSVAHRRHVRACRGCKTKCDRGWVGQDTRLMASILPDTELKLNWHPFNVALENAYWLMVESTNFLNHFCSLAYILKCPRHASWKGDL